jgi:hypothetical protein
MIPAGSTMASLHASQSLYRSDFHGSKSESQNLQHNRIKTFEAIFQTIKAKLYSA